MKSKSAPNTKAVASPSAVDVAKDTTAVSKAVSVPVVPKVSEKPPEKPETPIQSVSSSGVPSILKKLSK